MIKIKAYREWKDCVFQTEGFIIKNVQKVIPVLCTGINPRPLFSKNSSLQIIKLAKSGKEVIVEKKDLVYDVP